MAKKKTITAIALQGGGALGAYELGALKALYEIKGKGFRPRVVAGISIGAINGAFLVGAKSDPIGTLEEVWRERFSLSGPVREAFNMLRPGAPSRCFPFTSLTRKTVHLRQPRDVHAQSPAAVRPDDMHKHI